MLRNLWVQPTPFGVNSQHAQWPPNSPRQRLVGWGQGVTPSSFTCCMWDTEPASLASGPLSRRGRGDATPPSKWDGVLDTEPWANYSSSISLLWPCVDVTLSIRFVFSSDATVRLLPRFCSSSISSRSLPSPLNTQERIWIKQRAQLAKDTLNKQQSFISLHNLVSIFRPIS